ncbi:MAG: hypothetical protein KKB81_08355 [Candidatus Margulisbacteria bacterium]|nr:hypothetical protein [Candidatus Margulisiibacteriota bacterium]MBU1022625.1 hypothetical protein [Candidatus Margulisiibacteriota bacterium]MBU1729438.1 hypothetical protein [Candidatus Margulisiibacteriota bacterium]MBU1955461.1 hypothetical protein [Candidatus Margulisiibacteriota bacterium]
MAPGLTFRNVPICRKINWRTGKINLPMNFHFSRPDGTGRKNFMIQASGSGFLASPVAFGPVEKPGKSLVLGVLPEHAQVLEIYPREVLVSNSYGAERTIAETTARDVVVGIPYAMLPGDVSGCMREAVQEKKLFPFRHRGMSVALSQDPRTNPASANWVLFLLGKHEDEWAGKLCFAEVFRIRDQVYFAEHKARIKLTGSGEYAEDRAARRVDIHLKLQGVDRVLGNGQSRELDQITVDRKPYFRAGRESRAFDQVRIPFLEQWFSALFGFSSAQGLYDKLAGSRFAIDLNRLPVEGPFTFNCVEMVFGRNIFDAEDRAAALFFRNVIPHLTPGYHWDGRGKFVFSR